jgi:hypothetical protein
MTSCHNMSRSVLSATRTSASRCVAPICICAWVAAVRLRNHCGSRVGPLPEPATSTIVSTPPGPPRCRSGLDHRDQPEPIQSQRPFPPARRRRLHQGPRCFSMCSHARRSRTLTHVVMDRQLQITYRSLPRPLSSAIMASRSGYEARSRAVHVRAAIVTLAHDRADVADTK